VALSLALAEPERVSALVILNSFPYFAARFHLCLAIYGLNAMSWGTMTLVRQLTASRLHSRHTHRQEIQQFLELTGRATRQGYMSRLKLLIRYDVRNRLHDVRHPTLFLASDEDHLVPSVVQARQMAARVPGAVMRVLAGHGHICLIAPGVDLEQILNDWRPALNSSNAVFSSAESVFRA
jgi:pimeloyl-ACP methyl ester carboxylesterase